MKRCVISLQDEPCCVRCGEQQRAGDQCGNCGAYYPDRAVTEMPLQNTPYKLTRIDDGISVTYPWADNSIYLVIAFALVLSIFIAFVNSDSRSNLDSFSAAFLAVCLAILLNALVHCFSHTLITVTSYNLTKKILPLSLQNTKEAREEIAQVFVSHVQRDDAEKNICLCSNS